MQNVKPISAEQIRFVYGLARKAAMDNDTLHAFIRKKTGSDSIKALSSYQGKIVIDALLDKTGQEKPQARSRATREQIAKIYALEKALGWNTDPSRLRAWLEKRYKVSHLRFLTDTDASNCINGMKAMLKGGRAERRPKDDIPTPRLDE